MWKYFNSANCGTFQKGEYSEQAVIEGNKLLKKEITSSKRIN